MIYKTLYKSIKAFVFDMDGVLTSGTVLIDNNGNELRTMHVRDGLAINIAAKAGYHLILISGGKNQAVIPRLERLGFSKIFLNAENKLEILKDIAAELNLLPTEIAFMGDDLPDREAMKWCGISACPNDAEAEILAISSFISKKNGGNGACREFMEEVLRLNGQWPYTFEANG